MSIIPLPEGFKPIQTIEDSAVGKTRVLTRYSQTFNNFLHLFMQNHSPDDNPTLAQKALEKVSLVPLIEELLKDLYISGCTREVTDLFKYDNRIKKLIPAFVDQVLEDYKSQKPHSFLMMIQLIKVYFLQIIKCNLSQMKLYIFQV